MKETFTWPNLLKSPRFWSIVLIAVTGYLEVKGFIGEAEKILVWTIAGGFGLVRTVDRTAELVTKK